MTKPKKQQIVTETRLTKALQNLVRENCKLEEKIDALTLQTNAIELVLTTLVAYYKEIKELEAAIIKGLK